MADNTARYNKNKETILAGQKKYYERNRERISVRGKEYRERNADVIAARAKAYPGKNREKINAYQRERYAKLKAEGKPTWRQQNLEKARKRHADYCRQWLSDGKRRLSHSITCGVRLSLKGAKNGAKWEKLVGYTRSDLAIHMEKQFDRRMTWENYGDWHIDHIVPIVSFNFDSPDDDEFRLCWSLTNLRPLWAQANMSKGGRREHLI